MEVWVTYNLTCSAYYRFLCTTDLVHLESPLQHEFTKLQDYHKFITNYIHIQTITINENISMTFMKKQAIYSRSIKQRQ